MTSCRGSRRATLAAAYGRGHWHGRLQRGCLGLLLALGLLLPALAAAAAATAEPLPLLPLPVHSRPLGGQLSIDGHTSIVVAPGDAAGLASARYLAGLLKRTRGLDLPVRVGPPPRGPAIVLRRHADAAVAQPEGYALQVDADGVRIDARSEAGVFYGVITLWQLLTADGAQGPVSLAGVAIEDWPRFAWRGLMLDPSRHFWDVATVEQMLDAMAEHKLNVLHWHLSDDQGWRIEIKRYPELTRIGGWRTPPGAGSGGEPARYGGFYTQAQIREVVAYAAARHITVVPELDMPGHAQAAVAAYPDPVGVTGGRPAVSVDWGVNPYLYNVDDRSLRFIENVLDEVMALFPSRYIHLGGDEAVKDQWQQSPTVQAKIKALGLKDENALQSWFTDQLGDYLQRHGRRLIGWDEILEGGLPRTASVMSWRGTEGAVAAAKKDHDVVLAPAGWMYFDNLQSERDDEPSGRLSVLPLQRVYGFEPIDASLSAEQAGHVLGIEATLWSEYLTTPWHLQHAAFPRLDALAEIGWSPRQARDWQGFLQRLPAQLGRYRALGIAAADSAFAATIHLRTPLPQVLATGKASITLDNQVGYGELRYTTDGRTPDASSPLYRGPFEVSLPSTVSAAVFTANGRPLAAPRQRRIARDALLTATTGAWQSCFGERLGLRVPLLPDLGASAPVYDVDVFHACWVQPQAALTGMHGIAVELARLARNYGLAHDQSKVVAYPASTPHGELEVHQDSCQGPLLARLPLPAGDTLGQRIALRGELPAVQGQHDLCLRVTAPISGPLYGLGRVQLLPAAPAVPGDHS